LSVSIAYFPSLGSLHINRFILLSVSIRV
jgi:hypothetical protein